jgi:hypothetical protein
LEIGCVAGKLFRGWLIDLIIIIIILLIKIYIFISFIKKDALLYKLFINKFYIL